MTIPHRKENHLIIVSQHFLPSTGATSQLVTDLAFGLAREGLNITVLTSTPGPDDDSLGLCVHRSPNLLSESVNISSKAISGLFFTAWCLFQTLKHCRPKDSLLIVSNPPFIGLIGLFTKLFRGCHYIFLLQDLFPRSAELTGVLPSKGPLASLWSFLIGLVCANSHKTIVLSGAMKARAQKEYLLSSNQIIVIHNWAVEHASLIPKKLNPVSLSWKVDDVFTIQYSGNFGRLHEIITLLEAARLLSGENFHFLFVGGGAKHKQINQYMTKFSLSNVSLYPYQDRALLPYSLGACDVAAICLIPGSEDTVAPSKFYGIISSGKPVILVARHTTDIAQLILENKCGFVLDPGDPQGVANTLRYLSRNPDLLENYSQNALRLYEEHFGFERSLQQYLFTISELLQNSLPSVQTQKPSD